LQKNDVLKKPQKSSFPEYPVDLGCGECEGPEIGAEDLDGQPFKLSDYRGKQEESRGAPT
jgi:hypothetical protein